LQAQLRRMRPLVWLLRLPGVASFLSRRAAKTPAHMSPEAIRWFARMGYAHLLDALRTARPHSEDEWLALLDDAKPPPPADVRRFVRGVIAERRGEEASGADARPTA
jgi:hypothetical protein